MKIKITCPKCKSEDIEMVADTESLAPMYLCKKCGYKNKLFPKFESDKN